MTRALEQQEYYDLGNDTERWWRAHLTTTMPHLRHTPRCRGYDFKGSFEGHTIYVDTKFLREEYRVQGWIEVSTWGKLTGIISTAKEHYSDDSVAVFIAVLAHGQHYMIDAKALLAAWHQGSLQLHKGTSTDDRGQTTPNRHFVIDGWDDSRFTLFGGPLYLKHWAPTTPIGRLVDIDKWMMGEWSLRPDTDRRAAQ